MRSALLAAAAITLLATTVRPALSIGGDPPAPPSSRATARVVEVDLVAEDEEGRPVTDLAASDLVVLDEGREERIVSFSGPPPPSGGAAPPPLPPRTFTNRLELRFPESSSVTAVLLDALNTPQAERSWAREQVLRFLRQIPEGMVVSVYTLGRGLGVLEDFSTDPESLARKLEGYRGEPEAPAEGASLDLADSGLARFTSWLDEMRLDLYDHYAKDRALRTIRSLVAIAHHLERVPGRKSLVWVSGSFPEWVGRDSVPAPRPPRIGKQSFSAEIERAARALSSSGLAIYPVDARGVAAPSEYDPGEARIDRNMEPVDRSGQATMNDLAARTGGHAFIHTNDLAGAIAEAARDARSTYRLGYEPSHDEWNGRFRRIEVRVRRPGARLRHRSGYFAQPEEPSAEWYRAAALDAATWSPVESTQVGLSVRVAPAADETLDLEIKVRRDDVSLRPVGDGEQGTLDLWLVQLGKGDAHLGTVSMIADLRLSAREKERAERTGDLLARARLRGEEGAVLLRVLVRDVATGALGAVSIPLERVMGTE